MTVFFRPSCATCTGMLHDETHACCSDQRAARDRLQQEMQRVHQGQAQQDGCLEQLCRSPYLLSTTGLDATGLQDILHQPFCPAPILSADPGWQLPKVCSALSLMTPAPLSPAPLNCKCCRVTFLASTCQNANCHGAVGSCGGLASSLLMLWRQFRTPGCKLQ